jgi:imidazole glycerol phosphate synthase glutamine amidotransferase subunit
MADTKRIRIVPRLDIKGPNLVKGIHLEGLRVLGRPADFARHYYSQGADELMFMDVVASLYGRNSTHEIIRNTATDVHIPITVGGGIRTIQDIYDLLKCGADRVAINTAAVQNPNFIKEAVKEFGSSTIVATIEAIQQPSGAYEAFTDNGREQTGLEVSQWARRLVDLGAGEILLTSVDREGTAKGLDEKLIALICEAVSVPVIVHGGTADARDILNIAQHYDISGVAIASILHYKALTDMEAGTVLSRATTNEGNLDFLERGRISSKIQSTTLPALKKDLQPQLISRSVVAPGTDVKHSSPKKVAIVDYRMGNHYNLIQSLQQCGASVKISGRPEELAAADGIILPGVGAFGPAMRYLDELGLKQAIKALAQTEIPMFGICLGMQLFLSKSYELGETEGLDLIPGAVIRFPERSLTHAGKTRVPNMGWRFVESRSQQDSWLGRSLNGHCEFYFVHSYFAVPKDSSAVLGTASYDGHNFTAAIQSRNIVGTQFHPEKSGEQGLSLLRDWISLL